MIHYSCYITVSLWHFLKGKSSPCVIDSKLMVVRTDHWLLQLNSGQGEMRQSNTDLKKKPNKPKKQLNLSVFLEHVSEPTESLQSP